LEQDRGALAPRLAFGARKLEDPSASDFGEFVVGDDLDATFELACIQQLMSAGPGIGNGQGWHPKGSHLGKC
jgi:hypothetical protein